MGVVDPDLVGEVAGTVSARAGGSAARTRTAPLHQADELGGSRTRTGRGRRSRRWRCASAPKGTPPPAAPRHAVGALAHLVAFRRVRRGTVPTVCPPMGFWQTSPTETVAPDQKRESHPCAVPRPHSPSCSAPSPGCLRRLGLDSGSGSAPTWSDDRPEGHRGHDLGRVGHAETVRVEVATGQDVELGGHRRRGRGDPRTPTRAGLEVRRGHLDRDDQGHRHPRHGRRRAALPRQGHRAARGQLSPAPVATHGITFAHGIGGAKDLRSRPSSRSPGRPRRSSSPSRSWRSPGAARATTPRPAAGRRPVAGAGRRLDLVASVVSHRRDALAPTAMVAVFGGTWSSTRSSASSTCGGGSGSSRCPSSSARCGRRSVPAAPEPAPGEASGGDRGARRLHLPPSGSGAGGARPVRVRLDGLVYPYSTGDRPGRLWCAAYVAVMLVGGALLATRSSSAPTLRGVLHAGLADVGLGSPRRPARHPQPARQLDTTPVRPGLLAVMAVLFGSTAFDSFKDSTRWVQFVQGSSTRRTSSTPRPAHLLRRRGRRVRRGLHADRARGRPATSGLPNLFAHSVVPIVVGYIFAHYLSYLVEVDG